MNAIVTMGTVSRLSEFKRLVCNNKIHNIILKNDGQSEGAVINFIMKNIPVIAVKAVIAVNKLIIIIIIINFINSTV